MAIRAIISVAALLLVAAPAQAEWRVRVSDRTDIRSSVLFGIDDADPKRMLAITCTTLDGERIKDPAVSVAVPSSGKFVVRPSDAADLVVTSGTARWALKADVLQNDSTAFVTSVDSPAGIEIATLAAAGPGTMSVVVTAGDIDLALQIGPEGAQEAATQWLDACGER